MVAQLFLLPLLPAAGALVCACRPAPRTVSILAPGCVLGTFLLALADFLRLQATTGRHWEESLGTWLPSIHASWGLLLDPLSATLALIVTGVGFLVHVYAVEYMRGDPGYARFFCYMNLFIAMMLLLLLAGNYVLLFAGWEGVGLCSYLLIGFHFERRRAARAGFKAFLVNRVGDASFLIGILWLFAVTGSVGFLHAAPGIGSSSLSWVALLFFFGAAGKSAQFPLHVWLPDAMEGPTPVSALIHAATMVTAGVYLIARSSAIFAASHPASVVVAAVGVFTAIFAAATALVHTDIKRVLAYSTVSQLGFMFLALGVGAWWVAVFHLFTHAFFKALLFLGAGSIIRALDGEQDLRNMGGLYRRMPVTYWTMFVGAVALSGIPGLAGFFSKDAILNQTFGAGARPLYLVGVLTSGLTAIYMWRLMHLAFYVPPAGASSAARESPGLITGPLVTLAVASAMAGWIGVPASWKGPAWMHSFEHWLAPVFSGSAHTPLAAPGLEWVLTGVSAAVALIGMALARYLYHHRPEIPKTLEQALKPLHGVLSEEWYLDRAYQLVFVRGMGRAGGLLMNRFDRRVLDAGVRGTGWLVRASGQVASASDRWIVDGAVRALALGVRTASYPVRALQSGVISQYAWWAALGLLGLLGWAPVGAMMQHILTVLLLTPMAGAALVLLLPGSRARALKFTACGTALATFAVSLALLHGFQTGAPGFQFTERVPWVPLLGIDYSVGVDGISLLLVLLATAIVPLALLASWNVAERVKEFCVLFLLLEGGILGVFVSLDAFLFYVFFEAVLIPMYFIIGIWGGPRRLYAAIKFFLYTLTGSVVMLLGLLALYFFHFQQYGFYSFEIADLLKLNVSPVAQQWIFWALFCGFAIKVPMFPFHTWLPDAHVEAPTAGSVVLASLLLKMGTYGFIRFSLPLLPAGSSNRAVVQAMAWLSIVAIIYAALVSLMQRDWKRLVAYSSVSHMGFCTLGIFALNQAGLAGSVLQQINHGITTGLLFLLVGMIYERRHTREIAAYGGVAHAMPRFAAVFGFAAFASAGLPLLNGFVGEFTILQGVFAVNRIWAACAVAGIVLAAGYLLWLFQRTMLGDIRDEENRGLRDLNARELCILLPLVIWAVTIGLYPKPYFDLLERPVAEIVGRIHMAAPASPR